MINFKGKNWLLKNSEFIDFKISHLILLLPPIHKQNGCKLLQPEKKLLLLSPKSFASLSMLARSSSLTLSPSVLWHISELVTKFWISECSKIDEICNVKYCHLLNDPPRLSNSLRYIKFPFTFSQSFAVCILLALCKQQNVTLYTISGWLKCSLRYSGSPVSSQASRKTAVNSSGLFLETWAPKSIALRYVVSRVVNHVTKNWY